jgi:hypothetical protein
MILAYCRSAQAQDLSFSYSYDAGGNMTQRQLQLIFSSRMGRFTTADSTLLLNFKIYPNPTNQFLNIEGPLPEDVTSADVRLLNLNGQVLKTEVYTGQLKTLPVSDLNNGMYLLEINYSKEKRTTYKIIVTH